MTKTKSQQQRLRSYLRQYGKITAKQALDKFGTKNLRARIYELRNEGWDIRSEESKNNRTVVYRVAKQA